jgi:hypothetical protein
MVTKHTSLVLHPGNGEEMDRWCVPVRCTSHKNIWTPENGVVVFACGAEGAKLAAIDKMQDKYLRHQDKFTEWEVIGEPWRC